MEGCLELILHTTLGIAKTLMKCIEAFLDSDIVLDIVEILLDIKNYCKKTIGRHS
ncbi:hypothetical protein [Tepidibacter aestuarii]|uniref:hypothetical protein n=1 Tax=Tepidibacter aestuarii TaxID=2925782 RepID=UPI0020BD5DD0|nr:hypothetical protein [Tepidibacter aestuarii]CAH2213049.1 protein of unknown function [Tepidibacter aestuarii]